MNTPIRVALPLLLCLSLVAGPTPGASGAETKAKHYVCAPCGMPCDKPVYDHPGTCPVCGAALVDQATVAADASTRTRVAILIFNGVEIIDYTGPYEVFGAAGFDVYTVAATKDAVTTAMGMTVVPQYTFADAPRPDVLVVPGGGVNIVRGNAPTLKWVTDVTAADQHTLSVCNGAFILASAGLLEGLTATTTAGRIEQLRSEYPKTRVVDDQRFVDNGRIITAAGLSSGIDGALHVVARLRGEGYAQQVALVIEYDWRPQSGFARAALADRLIPDVNLDAIGTWDIVSTKGGTDHWELVVHATSDKTVAELQDYLDRGLATGGKWTKVASAAPRASAPMTDQWTFSGRDGRPWTGTLTIDAVAGQAHQYTAKLTIARAG